MEKSGRSFSALYGALLKTTKNFIGFDKAAANIQKRKKAFRNHSRTFSYSKTQYDKSKKGIILFWKAFFWKNSRRMNWKLWNVVFLAERIFNVAARHISFCVYLSIEIVRLISA